MKRNGYRGEDARKVIRRQKIQEEYIRKSRTKYLKSLEQLRGEYDLIYLDETYIHRHYHYYKKILLPSDKGLRYRIKFNVCK